MTRRDVPTQEIHLSNGTSFVGRLGVCRDYFHEGRQAAYKLYWVNPDGSGLMPAFGACDSRELQPTESAARALAQHMGWGNPVRFTY